MAHRHYRIDEMSELAAFFGGSVALARWLRVPHREVRRWIAQGEVARAFALPIALSLHHAGVSASPKLFGKKSWSEFVHPRICRPLHSPNGIARQWLA